MDPDLVRQQEEAEREARLTTPKAPIFVKPQHSSGFHASAPRLVTVIEATAVEIEEKVVVASSFASSPIAIFGRFVNHCIAGAIMGGAASVIAVRNFIIPLDGATAFYAATGTAAAIFGLISLWRR